MDKKTIKTEKVLVKGLECDELCAIGSRKEFKKQLENKKLKKLAEGERQQKMCRPCFEE